MTCLRIPLSSCGPQFIKAIRPHINHLWLTVQKSELLVGSFGLIPSFPMGVPGCPSRGGWPSRLRRGPRDQGRVQPDYEAIEEMRMASGGGVRCTASPQLLNVALDCSPGISPWRLRGRGRPVEAM